MERWKPVKGYENYWVSTLGRVKNIKYGEHGRIVGGGGDTYLRIYMSKNKKATTKAIHRLIAETFIPNPNNLPFVDHVDNNIRRNCVHNLRWSTRAPRRAYKSVAVVGRKTVYLGSYPTSEQALHRKLCFEDPKAAIELEKTLRGEYERLCAERRYFGEYMPDTSKTRLRKFESFIIA
jgi:hypothetical protein